MPEISSSPDTPSARLVNLNQQAIAILRLGIPLDYGFGTATETIARLREINDRLMQRAGQVESVQGESVDTMLSNQGFPERYDAIARMLLAANDPTLIFESLSVGESERQAATHPIRQAFSEPFVIAALVYFSAIFLCVVTIPQIEAEYAMEELSPEGITLLMIGLKNTLPIWAIGFPIVLVFAWVYWNKFSQTLYRWFPGGGSFRGWLSAETQSRQLAALAETSMDCDTAVALVQSSSEQPTSKSPNAVPPIAESIMRKNGTTNRKAALIRLAKFYRYLGDDRRRSYFGKSPAIIGLMFAGIVVFGYALATLLPWIEVLENLSNLEVSRL